jgi:hypothetical protein
MTKLPQGLESIVSEKDFLLLLKYSNDHLAERKFQNIRLEDGLLKYENSGSLKIETNFVNLVKTVLCHERAFWQVKTEEFLAKLNSDDALKLDLFADFEKAKSFLALRLHSVDAYEGGADAWGIKSHFYKSDIPDTYTVLVLDLPETFHILRRDEAAIWHQSEDLLFEVAGNNTSNRIDKIEARRRDWNGADILTIFDSDYSASYCIDFKNNCENLIGKFGSIVCFPTKGSVFVHLLQDAEGFNAAYPILVEQTNKFFNEDPGPITRNIYWYFDGAFVKFELDINGTEITYNIPRKLLEMLD